jgi:hypothetical protein
MRRPASNRSEMSPDDAGTSAQRPLSTEAVLRTLGAVAGLAGLVYVVGATMMWLRFRTTGFNADVALSVVSRDRLVALGFRTLATWSLIVALGTVLCFKVANRVAERMAAGDSRRPHLVALLLAGAAVVGAAFVTWGVFTLVVAGVVTVFFVRWYCRWLADNRRRGVTRGLRWPAVLFVALVAALASIGWQLEVNLPYDHAHFQMKGLAQGRDAIYFGQSDGNVYMAPRVTTAFSRDVTVYPRENVASLALLHGTQTLCTRVAPPASAAWSGVRSLWAQIQQRLRKTGQPNRPGRKTVVVLPRGKCPPL